MIGARLHVHLWIIVSTVGHDWVANMRYSMGRGTVGYMVREEQQDLQPKVEIPANPHERNEK